MGQAPALESKPLPAELNSHGWFAMPDGYEALWPQNKISGIYADQILKTIGKATLGNWLRPEWAAGFTAAKFAKACKCVGDTKFIELTLADMSQADEKNPTGRGLIERQRDGKSWKYKLSWANWAKSPQYDKNKMYNMEVELEETTSEEAAPPADIEAVPVAEPLLLLPGKDSKPFTLPKPPSEKYRWRNETPYDLSFSSLLVKGTLVLTAHDGAPAAPKIGYFTNTLSGTAETKPVTVAPPAKVAPAPPQDKALRLLLDQYYPTDSIIRKKVAAALKGTPLDFFEDFIKKSRKRLKSAPLFINLAEEASEKYSEMLEDELAREPEAPPPPPRPLPKDGNTPWGAVKRHLQGQLSEESFQNWFSRTAFASLKAGVLHVHVPDAQTKRWLESEYPETIQKALAYLDLKVTVAYELEP